MPLEWNRKKLDREFGIEFGEALFALLQSLGLSCRPTLVSLVYHHYLRQSLTIAETESWGLAWSLLGSFYVHLNFYYCFK
jgi:hypothetical protein